MKITLVPPAVNAGPDGLPQFLTAYLVNDAVAVDAGSLGLLGDLGKQQRIKHVFISHTHIDHLASLPIFLENVVGSGSQPVTVHGTAPVLDCLRKDLFNDRLWPDFINLSRQGTPFVKLSTLHPGKALEVEGLRVTPVAVNHIVPTCGFIIEDKAAGVVIAGDTGPTDEIWDRANSIAHLKAVFLEATFPNSMGSLADIAKHLTPMMFAAEARKLKERPTFIAVHLKAGFRDGVSNELKSMGLGHLEIVEPGRIYEF